MTVNKWDCSIPGALSKQVIDNTSNNSDAITTPEEEVDYNLMGMDVQPPRPIIISQYWMNNGKNLIQTPVGEDNPTDEIQEISSNHESTSSMKSKRLATRAKRARPPLTHNPNNLKSAADLIRLQQYSDNKSARTQNTNDERT